jgi:thimet oligopeptidase
MKNFSVCFLLATVFLATPYAKAKKALPFSFYIQPAKLTQACAEHQQKLQASIQQIMDTQNATFSNTVVALEQALAWFDRDTNLITFLAYVSPDADLREASKACELEIEKMYIDLFANQALFEQVQQVVKSKAYKKLNMEDQRLVDAYHRGFISNGLGVEKKEDREQVVALKKEIAALTSEFAKNIREKTGTLWVTKEQLAGMDPAFIARLERKKDQYQLTTDYPVYMPFMRQGSHAPTRKALAKVYQQRGGKENVNLLETTLVKRAELAKLLGFETHAHAVLGLKERMAQSPQQVQTFITELQTKLKPLLDKDVAKMKQLKCKEIDCKKSTDTPLEIYDVRYYRHQMKQEKGNLDMQKIQEYFPLDKVTEGMFEIYQTLLGVSFQAVPNPPRWHEAVKLYQVTDSATDQTLGYFYMDLFPREGKYKHAAAFNLGKPQKINGQTHTTLSAMVCNFTPPSNTQPSLLTHDEVETYFHEFGHVMHGVVSQTQYASQGGTSVARDFVEAPSQMLENWVWDAKALALLSSHYQTGQPLPQTELDQLSALQTVASGYNYSRQLFYAMLDMQYHTATKAIDTMDLWGRLQKEYLGIEMLDDTYPQASFGHPMGGYDAGYYGYMWSKVYAQDMYTRFERKGILNPKVGARYRKWILEKGSAKPADVLVRKFLKRSPNQQAFIESLGL